jgi:RNA polymerase sigma-70 factor (ECF subfamily)
MPIDIQELYRSHGPMVLRRCRRLLYDEAAAADAMHDVFVELLRRRDTLHEQNPASLLLITATNRCLNRLRTIRRRPEDSEAALLLDIAAFGRTDGSEDRALARRLLDRILGGESESTRLIAVLRFVDQMTLEEVAAEVGLSVAAVRKRLRRVKRSHLQGNLLGAGCRPRAHARV